MEIQAEKMLPVPIYKLQKNFRQNLIHKHRKNRLYQTCCLFKTIHKPKKINFSAVNLRESKIESTN